MINKASEKIAGGKLVRVEVDFSDKIDFIKITGDFFMHPETAIEDIEDALLDTSATADENEIKGKIDVILNEDNVTLYGVTSADIARVLKTALSGGTQGA